jgi:hypothetical protein
VLTAAACVAYNGLFFLTGQMECWQNMPSIDGKHSSQYGVAQCNAVLLNKGTLASVCAIYYMRGFNP